MAGRPRKRPRIADRPGDFGCEIASINIQHLLIGLSIKLSAAPPSVRGPVRHHSIV
jgi:hypothetical protein